MSENTFIFADPDDVSTGVDGAEYFTPEDGQDVGITEPLEVDTDGVLASDSV